MPGLASLSSTQTTVNKVLKGNRPRGWLKYENLECNVGLKAFRNDDKYGSKLLHSVKFEQDSLHLTDTKHYHALDIIGEDMPAGEVEFHLHGYASHEGSSDYNVDLSCARANLVREILEGEHGQTVARSAGMGEVSPENADAPPNPEDRRVDVWVEYEQPKAGPEDEVLETEHAKERRKSHCAEQWRKYGVLLADQFPTGANSCIMNFVSKESDNFARVPDPGYWDQFLSQNDVKLIDQMAKAGLEKDQNGNFEFPNSLSSNFSKCLVSAVCRHSAPSEADLKRSASTCFGKLNKGLNWLDFQKAVAWGDRKIQDVWKRVRERHADKDSIYSCYPTPKGSLNLE